MRVKCFSVRLESLVRISGKAYKAIAFDGSSDIIPTPQIYGRDYEVKKSDAFWISAWILEKKNIQYTRKKEAWFDSDTRKMLPTYYVERHIPEKINPVDSNEIPTLAAD